VVFDLQVGVLALQGDVSEHLHAFDSLGVKAISVRRVGDLEKSDALVIPGGESTTISELMQSSGLFEKTCELALGGFPVWGTCAGAILLASKGDSQVRKTGQALLNLMQMQINRNAFGRQRESFEAQLNFKFSGKGFDFPGIFIRAPSIERVWGNCKAVAFHGKKIVAAVQGNLFATAFHPELTGDGRIHEFFLEECCP